MSITASIREALETHLNNTPDLPDVAWENVLTEPDTDSPFIAVTFQPTTAHLATMGPDGVIEHRGLFTLGIHYPTNQGPQSADTMVDTLMARFAPGTSMTADGVVVRVRRCQRVFSANSDGAWYMVPLTVTWYAFEF
jgi:hypothetical protein